MKMIGNFDVYKKITENIDFNNLKLLIYIIFF